MIPDNVIMALDLAGVMVVLLIMYQADQDEKQLLFATGFVLVFFALIFMVSGGGLRWS